MHFADNSVATLVIISFSKTETFVSFFCPLPAIIKSTPAKSDSYIDFADTDIDLLHNFFISAYSNSDHIFGVLFFMKKHFPVFFLSASLLLSSLTPISAQAANTSDLKPVTLSEVAHSISTPHSMWHMNRDISSMRGWM